MEKSIEKNVKKVWKGCGKSRGKFGEFVEKVFKSMEKKYKKMYENFFFFFGKSIEKMWQVDFRPYLLVCQRSISNLRASNEGGCSRPSIKIDG